MMAAFHRTISLDPETDQDLIEMIQQAPNASALATRLPLVWLCRNRCALPGTPFCWTATAETTTARRFTGTVGPVT